MSKMKTNLATASFALAALGACSAGSGFFGTQEDLFIGTKTSSSANGLPFAVASSVLADLETAGPIKIKAVRAFTDWETGTTRLLVSNETLTLTPGDTGSDLDNITITLGGETLVFNGNSAPASNGQPAWTSYLNSSGAVSGTGAVYSYTGGPSPSLSNEFDTEAFFAFGYETNPSEIVALVGNAVYNGNFDGWGQVLDPGTGDVLSSEESFSGTIQLTANFDTNNVAADLDGTFDYDGTTFASSFSAPIEGNGYLGSLDTMTCASATCISNSQVGGAFYGTNAMETSGVMGMDVQVVPLGGGSYRYIAGGGFTAIK